MDAVVADFDSFAQEEEGGEDKQLDAEADQKHGAISRYFQAEERQRPMAVFTEGLAHPVEHIVPRQETEVHYRVDDRK